jgi:alpha-beta hydrolase superfamily lysophospholipase
MQSSTFTLSTADGTQLHVNRWLPDGPAKAVVQVAHGMAEHSDRYARFARRLTDAGYAVYAGDIRGHGGTAVRPEDAGYFADSKGWDTVVDDLRLLADHARAENPGLPFFLFGHSTGSLLARSYVIEHGEDLDGLILSGTSADQVLLRLAGQVITAVQSRVLGRRHVSNLLDRILFAPYNAAFRPTRTKFDWLSRDEAEVDKYVADPRCGNVFTTGFYADLASGLGTINSDRALARIRKDLPIHLASGSLDPVGAKGKGVQQVAEQYRRLGVRDVTVKLWPDARHEILNETNRDEVEAELVDWLDAHLPAARAD